MGLTGSIQSFAQKRKGRQRTTGRLVVRIVLGTGGLEKMEPGPTAIANCSSCFRDFREQMGGNGVSEEKSEVAFAEGSAIVLSI